jgi:hypothetical protein
MPSLTRIAVVCLILAILTIAAFWQLKDNGFINYDDIAYVTENPQVQEGLSLSSFRWAFTAAAAGYHKSGFGLYETGADSGSQGDVRDGAEEKFRQHRGQRDAGLHQGSLEASAGQGK